MEVREVVLITGGTGQLGEAMLPFLHQIYGIQNIIVTSRGHRATNFPPETIYQQLDATDESRFQALMEQYHPQTIYHFASMLSAPSERDPKTALDMNMKSTLVALEMARIHNCKIFLASSITAFGAHASPIPPALAVQRPRTIYGITKVHMELLGEYYFHRWGVDVRALRIPIVVSATKPGGGFAACTVEMFYAAKEKQTYICPLNPDSKLGVAYIQDVKESIYKLMSVPRAKLSICTYNEATLTLTPAGLAAKLKKHWPGFEVEYRPDHRSEIAATVVQGLEASQSAEDWGDRLKFGLEEMVEAMVSAVEGSPE